MSHAPRGGQAPDQASSGRQTGAAVPPGQIIPKARNTAGPLTSHKQHGDTRLATAPDRPTRRVSQSLESPRAPSGFSRIASPFMARAVKRANGGGLRRLKAILERHSEA
jgi:hypothetical protein